MEQNQLAQLDKSVLISMVADLTQKNNRLKETVVDLSVQNTAFLKRQNKASILFGDFMEKWLTANHSKWQRTTFDSYRNNVHKHIAPYFFEKKLLLADVTMFDIQDYYQCKLDEGLTANTVIKHHNNIRCALIYAKKAELIETFPMQFIDKPSPIAYEATFYEPEEVEQLITLARDSRIFTPILLAAFLGLRRSEILGLKWDAINFEDNTITIKRKLVRITENGKDVLIVDKDMKTKLSRRTLCMPKQLANYLRFFKAWQRHNQKPLQGKPDLEYAGFVCVNERGKIISPTNLSNTFARLIKNNNLRYLRFHDLRHSCASILYALGNDLKDIQEWLGHSNIGTTANLYIHLSFQRKIAVAQKLNAAIQIKMLDSAS